SFTIFNDSLIIGRSPTYIAKPYALFFQTFNGKFVSGIPNVKKRLLGTNPKETHQPSFFCIGKDNIRISFQLDDTLYTLNNNELVPYIIIVFKKPRETPPNAKVQKGDREIIFPGIEPTSFLIIGVSIIEEITWFTPNSGKSQTSLKYFFFNKLNGKHSIIRTYVDDFSGSIQSPEEGGIKFPLFLKNGKIVVVYEPKLIKQIAEDGQINSILTPILKNQIGEINESLQETDNPILLIGRVKEKI
ncbi:MAG: hypothetical protein JW702_05285, partial [Clostridiales bacterium]|nr:hypothetical protein [Clostridiales bacterium]